MKNGISIQGVNACISAFKNLMEYVIVGDDCLDCSYIQNALTLLRLPYSKHTFDAIQPPHFANAYTTFVCPHLPDANRKKLIQLAREMKLTLITWGNIDLFTSVLGITVYGINMPFNQFELENRLKLCAQVKQKQVDFTHPVFNKLVGGGEKMNRIKAFIQQVAEADTTVLILGESGTGKDIVASSIHQMSLRHTHHFVPINCGAIPTELMESELFGHEKGAFTGAAARRAGRFEMANRGTLFLDEIGDMPLPMQVKLLRVLQDHKIERVGGNQMIEVNVRLIAATHKKLEEMIQQNLFREDLFYRLNVFPIHIPALRERKEDIPLIINYHLDKIYPRVKHTIRFTEKALSALCEYGWPGNIRELQNFLERMVILHPDRVVDEHQLNLPVRIRSSHVAVTHY